MKFTLLGDFLLKVWAVSYCMYMGRDMPWYKEQVVGSRLGSSLGTGIFPWTAVVGTEHTCICL